MQSAPRLRKMAIASGHTQRVDANATQSLSALAETMATLSLAHLTLETRQKLLEDGLSVNAYPTDFGGFIFVGAPTYRVPAEPDLARVFEAALQAGVVWLKFDSEAGVVDGLPVYEAPEADALA